MLKKCEICGREFDAIGNSKTCGQKIKVKCEICGKEFFSICNKHKYSTKCSKKCKNIYTNKMTQKGLLKKYGVNAAMKVKEIANKNHKNQIEKFGCLGFNTQKQKDTMFIKYGVENNFGRKDVKEKIFSEDSNKRRVDSIRKTCEKHGVEWMSKTPAVKQKISETRFKKINSGEINFQQISKINLWWKDFLDFTSWELEKPIFGDGRTVDLFAEVNGIKLAIEINPTITHSYDETFFGKCLEKNYHLNRSLEAASKNIHMIHVWDWNDKEKMKSFIRSKLKLDKIKIQESHYELKEISQKDANIFLEKYHLQGGAKGQTLCVGAFKKGELLGVSTFGPSRFNKNYDWEFIRNVTKDNVWLQNFVSKSIKFFNVNNIVSYTDASRTNIIKNKNNLLKPVPSPVWSKGNSFILDSSLRVRGADILLETKYGSPDECGMNNSDIMLKEGWRRVFTCGNWREDINVSDDLSIFNDEKPKEE
nr:MAG TPA: endonuclease-like protein [Caudoviricetes sp.]